MIQITCAGCEQILAIPDEYAGTVGKCNSCGSQVIVPPLNSSIPQEGGVPPTSCESEQPHVLQEPPERDSIPISDISPVRTSGTDPVYSLSGVRDVLEVYDDRIAITPKGILGFIHKGSQGRKEITLASIVAIQFRNADNLFNGYLLFKIVGRNESRGGLLSAVFDENSFIFRGWKNNARAEEIRFWINKQMDAARSASSVISKPTLSSELEKLVSLRDAGVLSEDEFTAAKTKLLQ